MKYGVFSEAGQCLYLVACADAPLGGIAIPDALDAVPSALLWLLDGEVVQVEPPQEAPSSLKDLADAAMATVNAEYVVRMGAVANAYPLHERESWPIQLAEAKDLMTVGDNAVTPWMDQCALQRGLTRLELAQRIVAKDTAYRQVSGFFSGVRQWHEDCIDLLLQQGEEARADLQAYDHLQGWEPAG
ncbi:hypothetical protein [Comamonas terrigena]|uniref:hypothetical protein n=1 Tax=Comamonas terrigena TaxID=32013 RepID=UPI002446CB63|nr:hypothetical protein [Comamonas terrigena]MDH0048625.1 hypothetical protein [Comamonas terrigena]MDH0511605.1 hypothetical protein [Comamonas terrigena]MDH1090937.1 hypothetical protein [Comamonas terrigena]